MTDTTRQESGHDLATRLIVKHGTDRYPQVDDQALKLGEETGELFGAILKHRSRHGGCPRDHLHGAIRECDHVRKEYADAGLALYELGTKLGLDLMACMAEVVNGETRTFAPHGPGQDRPDAWYENDPDDGYEFGRDGNSR